MAPYNERINVEQLHTVFENDDAYDFQPVKERSQANKTNKLPYWS